MTDPKEDGGTPIKLQSIETPIKQLQPIDLRDYNGPMYVQNLDPVAQVISYSTDGKEKVVLGPAGKSEGRDVAILPISVAQNPSFQKIWRRGLVAVTTDPEMEEVLLMADLEQIKKDKNRADRAAQNVEEKINDKDLNKRECLECGTDVWISNSDLKKRPPMCPSHVHIYEEEPYKYLATPEQGGIVSWSKIK